MSKEQASAPCSKLIEIFILYESIYYFITISTAGQIWKGISKFQFLVQ